MEFVESHSKGKGSHGLTRLTITTTAQRNNYVSVPNTLASQLHDLGMLPVVLQLRTLTAEGLPSKNPAHTYHVAWVGDLQPGAGQLGLPSALARALSLPAGTPVAVSPLRGVPEATVVEVEPSSESDWEVVEANAGFLEDQILPQVHVLSRGQLFPVWARNGAAVRLRALSTQPADLVRLVPGCELHVAPRPRTCPHLAGPTSPAAAAGSGGGGGGGGGAGKGQAQGPWSRGQRVPPLMPSQQQQLQQTIVPLAGGGRGGGAANGHGRGEGRRSGNGDGPGGGDGGGAARQPAGVGAAGPQRRTEASPRRSGSGSGAAAGGGSVGPGSGLQARPAWAGALPRPSSGRLGTEAPAAGPAGAAAAVVVPVESMRVAATAAQAPPLAGAALQGTAHSGASPAAQSQVQGPHSAAPPAAGLAAGAPSQARPPGSEQRQGTDHLGHNAGPVSEHHTQQEHHTQPQQQPQQQQRPRLPPQALRLRVLDLPAFKYMVPLPPGIHGDTVDRNGGAGGGGGGGQCTDGGDGRATSHMRDDGAPAGAKNAAPGDVGRTGAAGAAAPLVSVWLTMAVAVAPATAAVLLGHPIPLQAGAAGPACGSGNADAEAAAAAAEAGAAPALPVVRLHGCGTVRDLLGVLVPEPGCPPGHVMLAPPLQHVLCVLPHMHVTVAALVAPPAPAPDVGLAAASLPGLTLHPLPVPGLRFAGDAAGPAAAGRRTAAAAAAATAAAGGGEAAAHASVMLGAAVAAAAAGSGEHKDTAAQAHALSGAVHGWMAAQMDGIRRAVLACSCGGSGVGGGGGSGCAPDVQLPLASGAVVHFRVHGGGGAKAAAPAPTDGAPIPRVASAVDAGGGGGTAAAAAVAAAATAGGALASFAEPGDYCLIVHARRRAHATVTVTAGPNGTPPAGQPPLVSRSVLAALLEASPPADATGPQTAHAQRRQPPPAAAAAGLEVKLGSPVVLPDVSYAAARHAAALAPRPLPPPPVLPPEATPSPALSDAAPASQPALASQQLPAAAAAAAAPPPPQPLSAPHLSLDLDHISWLGEQLERCLRRLLPQLDPWVSAAVARAGLPRCGGVLVTGPPGSGRSPLMAALGDAAERHPGLQAHVLHVRCSQLAGGAPGSALSALSCLASEALACAPSLLLLDDLDLMCPSAADGPEYGMQAPDGAAAAARLADWLAALLDELAAAAAAPSAAAGVAPPPPAVAVVASARDAAAVHAVLRRVGRLDYEVRLPTPGSRGRSAMLAAAARQRGVDVEAGTLAAVAGAAEGFEGVDLRLLLDRAVHVALRRQLAQQHQRGRQQQPAVAPAPAPALPEMLPPPAVRLSVVEADLRAALEGFVPAAFWGVQQAAEAGGRAEGWEDVGGLPDVVSSLREALLLPIKYRALVAAAPLRLRTGALLYGPPGCGKTHVVGAAVAAVAKIAPVRFLSVKGPELLNKYIGASEAAVRDLFARAAAAAPAVLFFDEFDAIAPPRGHDSTGVTDRVVNQLLTELDGVEGLRGVVVLAATSRPDLVDAALLRPGRLDRLLFCGPPEGPGERLQILRALSRRLRLAPDVDLHAVAEETRGMTGADLGAILSEAQLHAVNERLEAASAAAAAPPAAADGTDRARRAAPAAAVDAVPAEPRDGPPSPSAAASSGGAGATAAAAGGESGHGAGPAAAEPIDTCTAPPAGAGAGAGAGRDEDEDAGPAAGAGAAGGPLIRMRHLRRALGAARPSLPPTEAARLAALYARFRQDRQAAPAGRQGAAGGAGPEDRQAKRATLA